MTLRTTRRLFFGGLMAVLPLATAGAAGAADVIADAIFSCDDSKSIHAVFYPEYVDVTLTDGRAFILPQTMSGSGARYADADETIVFWNKGDTAFITEGGDDETPTYANCVVEGS